jgi:hypothetical protein
MLPVGKKHLISLSTPNTEWQNYPHWADISSRNVILIRCSSFQPSYEEVFSKVKRRWKNLIKVSHWENSISLDVEPKKVYDNKTSISSSTVLTIILLMGICILIFQYISNRLLKNLSEWCPNFYCSARWRYMWHLQKFLQYIKYITLEFTPFTIQLYPFAHPWTGFSKYHFPFSYVCTVFAPYSPSFTLSPPSIPPTGTNTPSQEAPVPLSYSLNIDLIQV